MNMGNKSLTIVIFVVIALSAIILIRSGRGGTQEALDNLESKFINTTTQEQEDLVGRFEENDIKDIQTSIEKYKTVLIPGLDTDMRIIREKILESDSPGVRDIYKKELLQKLKIRRMYREALIGYMQLQTWYYENKGGVLGGNFENIYIISGEAGVE